MNRALIPWTFALAAAACGSDPIVGGKCRTGLTECNRKCVDLMHDVNHCGTCDTVCSSDRTCFSGRCLTQYEIEHPDGSTSVGGSTGWSGAEYWDGGEDLDGQSKDQSVSDHDGGPGGFSGGGGASGMAGQSGAGTNTAGTNTAGNSTAGSNTAGSNTAGTNNYDGSFAGNGGLPDGGSDDATSCFPPYTTAQFCGSCEVSCSGETPKCTLTDGGYACAPQCNPPLVLCGDVCIDTRSDELNCGGCNVVCPTGICQVGKCVGAGFGQTVVMGMDYADPIITSTTGTISAQLTLLVNATMLTPHDPTRVLAFTEWADKTIAGDEADPINAPGTVPRAVKAWAAGRGRTITFSYLGANAGGWESVPAKLDSSVYDVFLVYDQRDATDKALATAGSLWNSAIKSYVKGGGCVIVLDGAQGNKAMGTLLTDSGILPVTSETPLATTDVINVSAPGDAVGLWVPNPMAAKSHTVKFETTLNDDSPFTVVVSSDDGWPVVLHAAQ